MATRSIALLLTVLIALLALPAPGGAAGAQTDCLTEAEPNDEAATAPTLSASGCVEGTLPATDQDLVRWEVGPGDAATRWILKVDGPYGSLTSLQLFPIVSEPGVEPPLADQRPMLEVAVQPDALGPLTTEPVMLPVGRYLLGITRGTPAGATDPTTGAYRFEVMRDDAPATGVEVEPNDGAEDGTVVEGEFSVTGDLDGSVDHFRWTVPEAESWSLLLEVPLGRPGGLELSTRDGRLLESSHDTSGARAYDLVLPAGEYDLEVSPRANEGTPYRLSARSGPLEGDAEPNDGPDLATVIEPGAPAWGRLGRDADRDRFRLDVPPGPVSLLDARLIWRSRASRTLCLLDDAGEDLLCREGQGGVHLRDLALQPGQHLFEVRGANDADDFYLLRLDSTTATAPDFESEPNDELALADEIDPRTGIRARGGDGDVDVYRLRTADAPQVWDIDAQGGALTALQLIRPSGRVLASADVAGDGSSARLADLYLLPGDHWLLVRSASADYSLTTRPVGAPDPDGEREPNDEAASADRYRLGERIVGRLPLATDRDFFRVTVAAAQRVRLDLVPPDDAAVGIRLHTGGATVATLEPGPVGTPVSWDLWLEAGDHHIELIPEGASEGFYELTSERLDPFAGGVDQEPNDDPAWARPVPPTLDWEGDPADRSDQDWFVMPATAATEPAVLRIEGDVIRVRAQQTVAGSEQDEVVALERDEDGSFTTTTPLIVGGQLLVGIEAAGPYRVNAEGAGWQAAPAPPSSPLELSWTIPVESVAAYWPQAQDIAATVTLANAGDDQLDVSLEAWASHYLWATSPPGTVSVPPSGTVTVDAPIRVGPDAWGTEDVLLSARATTYDGAETSATALVAVTPDAAAVAPRPGWSVPEPLLGGLNVAALAAGAEPAGTLDADQERRLFDGATPEGPTGQADQDYGNGFSVFVSDHVDGLPLEIVVDLAGEAPISVAGTIINPQASEGALREVPRDFELLLSTDGTTWQSAYRGTISPLRIDQPFVLDAPMPATHAMLRIWSKYVDQGNYLSLGEWKVIAEPGFELVPEGRDLAEPALGGHVVAFEPFVPDPAVASGMLDGSMERTTVEVGEALALKITIGFADDRAALVSEIGWNDPLPTDEDERLSSVDVYASPEAPSGPWRFLGSWPLERAADGSVSPFALDEPEWARYVQLRGRIPSEADVLELPAKVSVREHPSDDTYRSIVGEWGYRSPGGPFEALAGADRPAAPSDHDPGEVQAEAQELESGSIVHGRVEIGADIDWFSVEIPADHNQLELVVDGRPFVGVALTLVDESGTPVEMPFRIAPDGSVHYRADVEPGARYGIEVEQPPFAVTFAFDTSPSIGPFLDQVIEGIGSFLSDVQPGREVATLLPFDEPPLIEGWSDDRYRLQDAFENHVAAEGGSSSAEAALISASSLLAEREGARAILLVTDGETSSYERTPELWDDLGTGAPHHLQRPCRGPPRAGRLASTDAGLGLQRGRTLQLPDDCRRDGPGLRTNGHLAPPASHLQPRRGHP